MQMRPQREMNGGGALGFAVPIPDGPCCVVPGLDSRIPGPGGPGGRLREYFGISGFRTFSWGSGGSVTVAVQLNTLTSHHGLYGCVPPGRRSCSTKKTNFLQPKLVQNVYSIGV